MNYSKNILFALLAIILTTFSTLAFARDYGYQYPTPCTYDYPTPSYTTPSYGYPTPYGTPRSYETPSYGTPEYTTPYEYPTPYGYPTPCYTTPYEYQYEYQYQYQTPIVNYTLTINSAGATTVPITGTSTYGGTTNYTETNIPNGTSLTLTAPPTDGSANFVSWTGCDSTNVVARTCTETMNASKTVTANYIVSPPVTSNVSVTEPNYCLVGPSATIGWSYSDLGGSPQLAYQVQIDNQGSFASPEVDSGKITCQICRSYFSGISILQFNTTYNARVRTWNGNDIPSLWQEATTCTGDGCLGGGSGDWKTPIHAYPNVNPPYDFTYSPANPAANEPVQFTDRTLFAPTSISKAWSWIFVPAGGGSGSSSSQNPTYTLNQDGIYQVTERVRDNALPAGQYCVGPAKSVNIQKPIPIWKEIAPR